MHQFTYYDDGRLAAVVAPPRHAGGGGWRDLVAGDRKGEIVRLWETGEALPVPAPSQQPGDTA